MSPSKRRSSSSYAEKKQPTWAFTAPMPPFSSFGSHSKSANIVRKARTFAGVFSNGTRNILLAGGEGGGAFSVRNNPENAVKHRKLLQDLNDLGLARHR